MAKPSKPKTDNASFHKGMSVAKKQTQPEAEFDFPFLDTEKTWVIVKNAKMPTFGPNATLSMMIDELGPIRKAKSQIEKLEKFYSASIKARMEGSEAQGEHWKATLVPGSQTRVVAEKVREYKCPNCERPIDLSLVEETSETTTLKINQLS